MSAPYNALAVANYFLDLAKAKGLSMSPMKLQKLIYFAHGWYLALYKEDLIDEELQAWDYGPVVLSIYHEFKKFGLTGIDTLGTDFNLNNKEIYTPRIPMDDKKTTALLDKVWDVYGKYTGIQLSNLTHEDDSAWSRARAARPNMRSVSITKDMLESEFSAKIKN